MLEHPQQLLEPCGCADQSAIEVDTERNCAVVQRIVRLFCKYGHAIYGLILGSQSATGSTTLRVILADGADGRLVGLRPATLQSATAGGQGLSGGLIGCCDLPGL